MGGVVKEKYHFLTKMQKNFFFTFFLRLAIDFSVNLWYAYSMKTKKHPFIVTEKQISEFAENNDMIALAGDMLEDAGGHVIHESEVIDMIIEAAGVLEW